MDRVSGGVRFPKNRLLAIRRQDLLTVVESGFPLKSSNSISLKLRLKFLPAALRAAQRVGI